MNILLLKGAKLYQTVTRCVIVMSSSCYVKMPPENPPSGCCSTANSKDKDCCNSPIESTKMNTLCCDKARPNVPTSKCCGSKDCDNGNYDSKALTQTEITSSCTEETQPPASSSFGEKQKSKCSDDGNGELSYNPSVSAEPPSSRGCPECPSGLQNCCNGLASSKSNQHVNES